MRRLASVLLATVLAAAPAAAQDYVYGVTAFGIFNGVHFTPMAGRLITIDAATGQAIASLTLSACTEPTGDGSTIDVVVDGQVVGHPSYNQARPDVQALFPVYTNAAAPGGSFVLDTRTLSNGTHTIAWVVRDNAGNAKGIGSRFFTVQNDPGDS